MMSSVIYRGFVLSVHLAICHAYFSRATGLDSTVEKDVRSWLGSEDQGESFANIETKATINYAAEPYYPTPKGGWSSAWTASYTKAAFLVEKMTLAEKVNITTGIGELMGPCSGNTGPAVYVGFPGLCLSDSALGVAATENNTAFPAGITVGATFSKNLMYERGLAIGAEARGKGVNILLGPVVGPLGRKPRGGRNWEGFGADPVLQAIGGAQTINGIQDNGVIATIKHFIAYEQEEYRQDSSPLPHGLGPRAYTSNVDDRTLHELYLWPFAEGVKAGVGAVMTSYNEVNSSAASQNSMLMNGLLKDELGFQGFVMTDWLAHIGGPSSALSGLDMSMPGDGVEALVGSSYWGDQLSTAILNSSIPVDRLDDMVTRIVATWYQLGQDEDFPDVNFSANTDDATGPCYPGSILSELLVTCTVNQFIDVQADHNVVARNISREAITLLKNEDAVLPLSTASSLTVFGLDARVNPDGPNSCNQHACNSDGVLGMGWGSGTVNYPYIDAPIDAIMRKASNVTYVASNAFPSATTASANDIAIIFINSDSGEDIVLPSEVVQNNWGDRTSDGLYAWNGGDDLVIAAAKVYSTVIVVVHTVGPIILENWISLPAVKGVLFAHLPGQEAGDSLTDILFGDFSPSGHLPYSIPVAEDDYASSVSLTTSAAILGFSLGQVSDTFSEGLYIDYRYLNKANTAPRYAFGHGLSYTTFSFGTPVITSVTPLSAIPPARAAKGSTPTYNTSIPAASEVAWPATLTTHIDRYLYPYLDDPSSIVVGAPDFPAGYSSTPHSLPPAGGDQGGNPALWDTMFTLRVPITNTGSVSGKQVAMLFIQHPGDSSYDTPIIQLRDFEKTETLGPGASQTLELAVTRKDMSVWDVVSQNWVIPLSDEGKSFVFWVGSGSANLTVACYSSGSCETGLPSPV